MLGSLAFFSLAHLEDPRQHQAYNEWHQLDHRPENLALPGVAWGERWVQSPDCVTERTECAATLGPFEYLNMYWLREPVDVNRRAWSQLAERSFHWGRRADLELCQRPMMDFFLPITGRVADRVLVSPTALPIRPNRGVYVEITRWADGRSLDALRHFAWTDQVLLSELVARPGVAGAWTFASESTFVAHLDLEGGAPVPSTRVTLAYLDADPIAVFDAWSPGPGRSSAEPAGCETLYAGVLRSITPWQWDWFDAVEAPS